MKAKELMNSNIYYVHSDDSLLKCASIMKKNNIHFLPIVNNGKVIGTITDHDLCIYGITEEQNVHNPVENVMNRKIHTVDVSDSLGTILLVMQEEKTQHLLVHQDQKVVGVLSYRDLLHLNRSQDPYILTLKEIYKDTPMIVERNQEIDEFYL